MTLLWAEAPADECLTIEFLQAVQGDVQYLVRRIRHPEFYCRAAVRTNWSRGPEKFWRYAPCGGVGYLRGGLCGRHSETARLQAGQFDDEVLTAYPGIRNTGFRAAHLDSITHELAEAYLVWVLHCIRATLLERELQRLKKSAA